MSYEILYPLGYLILGFLFAKTSLEHKIHFRWYISAFLAKVCIPLVIAYTVAYRERGVFIIMLALFFILGIMLLLSFAFTKDSLLSLCFSFLNMGWLGIPIAQALFGDRASAVMIIGCVASSIFGNSLGAGILIKEHGLAIRLKRILKSPPFLALLVGIALNFFGQTWQPYLYDIYHIAKVLMSILGMMILGAWVAYIKISAADFRLACTSAFYRGIVFSVLISGLVFLGYHNHYALITENLKTLYLMALLPPAANIVVLETYYLRSGRSAPLIVAGTLLSLALVIIYAVVLNLVFKV